MGFPAKLLVDQKTLKNPKKKFHEATTVTVLSLPHAALYPWRRCNRGNDDDQQQQ
jgi:hypothetical protein